MDNAPVDALSDLSLAEVNAAHDWELHTLDAAGRQVGRADKPCYPIPHLLVTLADQLYKLNGKTVVEFGCLEGAHTIALCRAGARVTAIDARPGNLVKTAIRCTLYGAYPKLQLMDVEKELPEPADIYFHSGVLYHLQDPAHHLKKLSSRAPNLLLDTHYCKQGTALYRSLDGKSYRCDVHRERPEEVRAGMAYDSNWLPLGTITSILSSYYDQVTLIDDRAERNGPRATIMAQRRADAH